MQRRSSREAARPVSTDFRQGCTEPDRSWGNPALARQLAEAPEQQLADLADPDTLTLVIACAGASYKNGSSYLHALQARRDAARIGSATGIVRWTRVVGVSRAMVQADADAEAVPLAPPATPDPLPTFQKAGDLDRAGGAMLNRGGLIGALALAAIAAGAWWLAIPDPPEPASEPFESGSERARPEGLALADKAREGPEAETAGAQEPAGFPAVAAADSKIPPGKDGIEASDAAGPAPAMTEPQQSRPASAAAVSPQATAGAELASAAGELALFVPPPEAPLPDEPPGELHVPKLAPSRASASTPDDAAPVAAEQGVEGPASADGARSDTSAEHAPLTARAELQVAPASIIPQAPSPDAPLGESEVAAFLSAAPIPHANNRPPASIDPTLAAGPEGQAPPSPQTEAAPDQDSAVRTVRGEAVRLRRKPSLSAPILGVLSVGDEVRVDRTKGGWSHVIAKDGRSGWMAAEYLTGAPSTNIVQTAGAQQGNNAPVPRTDPAASEVGGPAAPAAVGGSRPAEPSSPAFIVDTVAPEAPDLLGFSPDSGATGDGLTNGTELVLTGTAEADSTVTVRDGETVLGTVPADGSGAWSFATGVLAEGAHSFTAIATDAAGNTGSPSSGFAVTVDTTAPSVALLTVKNDVTGETVAPTGLTNDNTPTLSGTAEGGSTVEVILSKAGAPEIVLTPTLVEADWSVVPGAPLTDGPYTVSVKATDPAGNATEVGGELLK